MIHILTDDNRELALMFNGLGKETSITWKLKGWGEGKTIFITERQGLN